MEIVLKLAPTMNNFDKFYKNKIIKKKFSCYCTQFSYMIDKTIGGNCLKFLLQKLNRFLSKIAVDCLCLFSFQ